MAWRRVPAHAGTPSGRRSTSIPPAAPRTTRAACPTALRRGQARSVGEPEADRSAARSRSSLDQLATCALVALVVGFRQIDGHEAEPASEANGHTSSSTTHSSTFGRSAAESSPYSRQARPLVGERCRPRQDRRRSTRRRIPSPRSRHLEPHRPHARRDHAQRDEHRSAAVLLGPRGDRRGRPGRAGRDASEPENARLARGPVAHRWRGREPSTPTPATTVDQPRDGPPRRKSPRPAATAWSAEAKACA